MRWSRESIGCARMRSLPKRHHLSRQGERSSRHELSLWPSPYLPIARTNLLMSMVAMCAVVAYKASAVRLVHRQAGLTVGAPVNGWLDCSGGEDRGSYQHPPVGGIGASCPEGRGGVGEDVEGLRVHRVW